MSRSWDKRQVQQELPSTPDCKRGGGGALAQTARLDGGKQYGKGRLRLQVIKEIKHGVEKDYIGNIVGKTVTTSDGDYANRGEHSRRGTMITSPCYPPNANMSSVLQFK